MTNVKRVAPLVALLALAVVGVLLIITGGPDESSLRRVTTVDGVEVNVPEGWVASADVPFRYEPAGSGLSNVDSWTIAWGCGPDGCEARTMGEWLEIGDRLETFVRARADEGKLLIDLVESEEGNARVLKARTFGGQTVVTVAVFAEGADRYLECNLAIAGDPGGLDEQIVKACINAVVPAPGS